MKYHTDVRIAGCFLVGSFFTLIYLGLATVTIILRPQGYFWESIGLFWVMCVVLCFGLDRWQNGPYKIVDKESRK